MLGASLTLVDVLLMMSFVTELFGQLQFLPSILGLREDRPAYEYLYCSTFSAVCFRPFLKKKYWLIFGTVFGNVVWHACK